MLGSGLPSWEILESEQHKPPDFLILTNLGFRQMAPILRLLQAKSQIWKPLYGDPLTFEEGVWGEVRFGCGFTGESGHCGLWPRELKGLSGLKPGHDEAGVLDLEWMLPSWLPLFQGSSVCQVTAIGVTVILLYTSRACYNLFILSFSQSKNVHSFDYDWYNVSDQVSGHR